jgi:hypothetical protein
MEHLEYMIAIASQVYGDVLRLAEKPTRKAQEIPTPTATTAQLAPGPLASHIPAQPFLR